MRSGLIDPRTDIPEIEVTFTNGVKQKMVLRHYEAIPNSNTIDRSRLCNYLGHLEGDEVNSSVALTGCLMGGHPDEEAHITLLSLNSKRHKSFSFDRNGKTKHIGMEATIDSRDARDGNQQQDQVLKYKDWVEAAAKVSAAELSVVPPILTINIRLGYDRSTKEYFEKKGGNRDNWLAEVMTHSQAHFLHSSLEHQIILKVNDGDTIEISKLNYFIPERKMD